MLVSAAALPPENAGVQAYPRIHYSIWGIDRARTDKEVTAVRLWWGHGRGRGSEVAVESGLQRYAYRRKRMVMCGGNDVTRATNDSSVKFMLHMLHVPNSHDPSCSVPAKFVWNLILVFAIGTMLQHELYRLGIDYRSVSQVAGAHITGTLSIHIGLLLISLIAYIHRLPYISIHASKST